MYKVQENTGFSTTLRKELENKAHLKRCGGAGLHHWWLYPESKMPDKYAGRSQV